MPDIIFTKGGSTYISSKIEEAVANKSRTATVSGNWEISEAIRLPSNFTLILEDAHLRMADGVYSNMFVNGNHEKEIGKTTAGTDRNINIIGRGKAILDGGKYNGLSEKTQLQNGLPPIWKNNLVLFTNVDGFKISGISCRNQRWWALNFIYCCNGYLGNINFCANDTAIDTDGNVYHGLLGSKYAEVLVKNADGIDLRNLLHHLKQPGPSGNTKGLQGRGDRQTNGLFRTAAVSYHQIGGHRVQTPLDALHGGIEGFQVNGCIGSGFHSSPPFLFIIERLFDNVKLQLFPFSRESRAFPTLT